MAAFSRRHQAVCERATETVAGGQLRAREQRPSTSSAPARRGTGSQQEETDTEREEKRKRMIETRLGVWEPSCGPNAPPVEQLHLHRVYERAAQGQLTMQEMARLPFELRLVAVLLRTKLLPYKTLLYQLRSIDQLAPAERSSTPTCPSLTRTRTTCSLFSHLDLLGRQVHGSWLPLMSMTLQNLYYVLTTFTYIYCTVQCILFSTRVPIGIGAHCEHGY